MAAFSPGARLSSTSVVLPEPDTPVTTVSRPLGRRTSSGFTVWMARVDKRIVPCEKSSSAGQRVRATCAVPARNGPIRDAESSASAAGVPWAITRPPLAPASGPISIIQFASESSCVS